MPPKGPILTASPLPALEYHLTRFDSDLAVVVGDGTQTHVHLSVASFCPDYPSSPAFANPAKAFARLPDQCWFLCSLFASQLIDQATHFVTGAALSPRAGRKDDIVIVGLLGSHGSVMHPGFLLLLLGLYRLPRPATAVADGLRDIVAAEIASLAPDPPSRATILKAAQDALAPSAMPDSLGAFVPRGDDYRWKPDAEIVELLRASAASSFGGACCP